MIELKSCTKSVVHTDEELKKMREQVRKIIQDNGSILVFKQMVAKEIRNIAGAKTGNALIEARIKAALNLIDGFVKEISSLKEKANGKAKF